MFRRRDVLLGGLGLTGALAAERAAGASTEAPGLGRTPRADRLAWCGGSLAQLRDKELQVRGPGGSGRTIALEAAHGLTSLPDGSALALVRRDGKNVALRVAAGQDDQVHPVWVVTGEDPIGVLPFPGDPGQFWILSPDRRTAIATRLVEKYGMLDEAARLSLDNGGREDVLALPDGLLFHHLDALRRVDLAGKERRVPWAPAAPVARLAPGPDTGSAWALGLDGSLNLLNLGNGAVRVSVGLGETGVALAADRESVVAITGSRPPNGSAHWTLHKLEVDGRLRYHIATDGIPPNTVVLSSDRVAAGDASRLWIWPRSGGSAIVAEP